MRLPKKVKIFNRVFDVRTDVNSNGATVDVRKRQIVVGSEHEDEVLSNYMHECLEVILEQLHCEYANHHVHSQRGDYIYVFDHDRLDTTIVELAEIIKPLLR